MLISHPSLFPSVDFTLFPKTLPDPIIGRYISHSPIFPPLPLPLLAHKSANDTQYVAKR